MHYRRIEPYLTSGGGFLYFNSDHVQGNSLQTSRPNLEPGKCGRSGHEAPEPSFA